MINYKNTLECGNVLLASLGQLPPSADLLVGFEGIEVATTLEELSKGARSNDVMVLWDFASQTEFVGLAPRLRRGVRWIQLGSVGADLVLDSETIKSDLIVTNCGNICARDAAIAEYAITLLLLLAKRLVDVVTDGKNRSWRPRVSSAVRGKFLVVLGYGPIGRYVAELATGLGLRVAAVNRTGNDRYRLAGVEVYPAESLLDTVADADYLVLAAPETAATRGIINRDVLRVMKSNAVLVNVARGSLIVEEDLIEALREGRLGGAGLDVVNCEPLPVDHPLWFIENLIISPHMSGDIEGWEKLQLDVFRSNMRRWLAGVPLENVVSKERGYVER